MYKKLASIFALMTVFTLSTLVPSHASIPVGCVFDQPRQISTKSIESYSVWFKRQTLQNSNANCFKDRPLVRKIYDNLAKKVLLDLQQTDKNDFNRRYDACTSGAGSVLSPKTWLISIKCLFTTSFFPTSDVLKTKFNELIGDFKSHQPTSYIPVALGVINNLKNNWGGIECVTGSISAKVTIPQMSQPWNFVIPCKPPTALGIFRSLMLLSVWLGFAFWLYRTGSNFWKERSA